MFNPEKRFYQVNREERCFVALLAHMLLGCQEAREHACSLLSQRLEGAPRLDPAHLEVYVEPAPLRDYWRELGDYKSKTGRTYEARRRVIIDVLSSIDLPPDLIDRESAFWTKGGIQTGRLWSPGHWTLGRAVDPVTTAHVAALTEIKQAWNSKPDLLLLSGSNGIFIEAKVESGFGKHQLRNAATVARLLRRLNSGFTDPLPLVTLTLGVPKILPTHADATLQWRELIEGPLLGHADRCTKRELRQLAKAYPKKYWMGSPQLAKVVGDV
jgi:hypothetical protein